MEIIRRLIAGHGRTYENEASQYGKTYELAPGETRTIIIKRVNFHCVGALIGVVLIVIDERLGKAGLIRLPPLAAGMGIYLPPSLNE